MAEVLKGGPVAKALSEQLLEKSEKLKAQGIIPTLAILRVGENESDLAYERGILSRCEKTGVTPHRIILPADASQEAVEAEIIKINEDSSVHAALMFRPLPKNLDERKICELLDPKKDADCMTQASLATVFTGKGAGYAPCTAQAVMELLSFYGIDPKGKNVAVIGRSLVIGRPVAMLLMSENATVTICHTRTVNMEEITKRADIIVAAAGKAKVVTASYLFPGQTVIDVGINVDESGNLCGDVDFDAAQDIVGAITPVPGGVGNVTTAVLCKHVIEAAEEYCLSE